MQIIFLLILISFPSFALRDGFTYSGIHRKTNFTISWDLKTLHFKDRGVDLVIKIAPCSQEALYDFMEIDQRLWRDSPAESPDPIIVKRNGKIYKITTRSQLGGHLISLRDKMRLLKTEIEHLCSK